MKLKHIAEKIFKQDSLQKNGDGLFVTIDELISQRRYAKHWTLTANRNLTTQQAGDVKSAFKGRGMEFEEIRAYTYGDDVRDIDWRVTARKQVPYTKLYAEEKDREVYVFLDFSPQMLFGTKKELKSVTAAKIAARIGWHCLENKDRFGCLLFSAGKPVLIKAQNSQANTMFIFQKIASLSKQIIKSPYGTPLVSFKRALQLLLQAIRHRAIIFIISDFNSFSAETQDTLVLLSKKADITCINIFDCLEQNPPMRGEYMVQQGDKHLVFSSENDSYREEYAHYFADKHQKLKNFCKQFHLHYIEKTTGLCDKF